MQQTLLARFDDAYFSTCFLFYFLSEQSLALGQIHIWPKLVRKNKHFLKINSFPNLQRSVFGKRKN